MEDRNQMTARTKIKELFGELPFAADLYWLMRNPEKKNFSRFNLELLNERLPQLVSEVLIHTQTAPHGKKVFFFASWHYWITHTALCGLVLRGLGHDVTLGFIPFSDYDKPISRFDLRHQDLYARHVLAKAQPLLKTISFLDLEPAGDIPATLVRAVEQVTVFDTQYTLQREDVTGTEPIYLLRHQRNLDAACKAFEYFQKNRPDVVIIPNGMIQEYGAVYETARFLGIPATTYEFGEHDQRIWLGQNRLVINHITDELWAARQGRKLNGEQVAWLESFLLGRQGLSTGVTFAHLWQKTERKGGTKIRAALNLDERPVVLLPTNVLGDSATLGLTVFSQSMAEWIGRVVPFFANRPEVQLVVRIHPAETWTVGPSVAEIILTALPELPTHIHLVGSTEDINTYDLMDIADLGLVYTTTAGLEMATRGIPVLVSGRAHYRKKGFTLDADSWDEFYAKLDGALNNIAAFGLTPAQVEQAWNYAYCFFNEYPRHFPWHLEKIEADLEQRPFAQILGAQGRAAYEATFQEMAGAPIAW
jgi:hypothetical protein